MKTLWRLAVAAPVLLALSATPDAAGLDCRKAASPAERAICADPALRSADATLQQRFDTALALSLDPYALRSDQQHWLGHDRAEAGERGALAAAYAARIAFLETSIARDKALRAETLSADDARATCLAGLVDPADGPCKVATFATIGTLAGRRFLYALYESKDAGEFPLTVRRILVFEAGADGRLGLALSPAGDIGIEYDPPRILRAGPRTLLHLPATASGTGVFNEERLFVWRDGAWHDVDTMGWLDQLAARLPKGRLAQKGIYPDYATLKATTPIWREADPNCCPTAGQADITLGWQGDRIVLKALHLRPSRPG